jgi:SAC3/GANP/Nin1/mts3/eIF-3 p25 family.
LKNPVPKIIAERVIILGKFEELLVIYSVKTKNFDELEKAYKRLRFYNEDLAKVINPSENYDKIAAIYLLYLLSFNRYISLRFELNPWRFSDFHIELEKIPEELQKNQYIQFTIKLEQWLTVGNYSNVLQSKKNSPLAYFNVFLERIFETIR